MPPTAAAARQEATGKIRELAATSTEPSVKGRLRAIARHLGLDVGRVAKYFYGLVSCPPAHEMDRIRAYYSAAQELIEARIAYEKQRESFLRDHPNLAFAVPGPIHAPEAAAPAAALMAHAVAEKSARQRRRNAA